VLRKCNEELSLAVANRDQSITLVPHRTAISRDYSPDDSVVV
jgi:hypothetical protein